MNLKKILGDLLKEYSQEEIGKEIGLHQATVSKIYHGRLKSIRLKEGLKLLEMHKKYVEAIQGVIQERRSRPAGTKD